MKRKLVQWLALLGSNAYFPGFWRGNIYKGPLKRFCVPGLNCYSCPGALGSCPLGALQSVLGSIQYSFSYYVAGLLLLFGVVLGRFVCGFLCPFGLIQELLHKIPAPKIKNPPRRPRYIKYTLLLVFVILMPLVAVNQVGMGAPAFCQYICPAGTLTAGLPLLAANAPLRAALGSLFTWKLALALLIVAGCVVIYRFFCRYLCPLGAIYALFNRISLYRLHLKRESCAACGSCRRACRMGVDPALAPNSGECIRCGDCAAACPHQALRLGWAGRNFSGLHYCPNHKGKLPNDVE